VTGTAAADHLNVFYKVAAADSNKRNGYFDDAAPGVPTGPPPLAAYHNGSALVLTWAECPRARLEQAASLSSPINWATVTNQASVVGGHNVVKLPPGRQPETGFFRVVLE